MSDAAAQEAAPWWNKPVPSSRAVLSEFLRRPALAGLFALASFAIAWAAFRSSLGELGAFLAAQLFLLVWLGLAVLLPAAFKVLFALAVLAVGGGGYIVLQGRTTDVVGSGILAFAGAVLVAALGLALLRGEVLVPAALGGALGLAAYLELGSGVAPVLVGALVFFIVFVAGALLCFVLRPFVVAWLWTACAGLAAYKLTASLLFGAGITQAWARELLHGGAALLSSGGGARALLALAARAAVPFSPPLPVAGWIAAAACAAGAAAWRAPLPAARKPDDPEAAEAARKALELGREFLAAGRFDEAVRCFDGAAELPTMYREMAQVLVAVALLRKGDFETGKRAASRLDSGVLSNPQRYMLGVEFERTGDLEEAEALYGKIHASDPRYEDVRERLENLRRRQGDVSDDEIATMVAKRVIDRRYQEVKLVARGAMGFVFRARDTASGKRLVAIKAMSPMVSENKKEAAVRFIREAQLAAGIEHPNVVRIFEVYPGALPYYTMEFIRAQSLAELLRIRGRLEPAVAAEIAAQMCDGLHAAHARGITHRDVKPGNALVDEDFDVKLVDFGIAKFDGATKLTQTGAAVGTPLYMSPEQVRGEAVGPASDVYSTGVVLFEMLAGRPPFEEMPHHLTLPVPALPAEARVPPPLEALVRRALAKAAPERFGSAAEFAAALRAWRGGAGEPPKAPGGLVELG